MMARIRQAARRRPVVWASLGAAVALLALALVVVARTRPGAEAVPLAATFAAERGPLVISITESGTIQSRDQVTIKSEVEGQPTILYLIPEGTRVKKGDLLVELDSSELLDRQAEKQITVFNAEAAYVAARENLAVVQNQAQAEIAQAELDARFAKEDLQNYLEGESRNLLTEAQAKITLAEEELKRVEEKAAWSRRLYEEKYISQTELQADEIALNRAKLDLELAEQALDLLQNFTIPRRTAELESQVEQTALALERVRRKAAADIAQAESGLKAKEFELARQRDLLAKIEHQIERCKIYAPTDGLVVYATTGRGGWRDNDQPLEEGQTVRERQELIYLPTTNSVTAEVSVHESNLNRVRPGLPVRITVDALPGRVFSGRVVSVAPLPDAQSVWMNPDLKVYKTRIDLMGDVEGLRTGMSCRAEILVERHTDAIYVPVQSVLRVNGQPTVYVARPGRHPEPRAVELGLDNNRMAHIINGLEEGERVLLSPPLAAASQRAVALAGDDAGLDDAAMSVEPSGETGAETDGPPAAPGPTAGAEGPSGDDAERGGGEGRPNLPPEQIAEMRRRFENLSPEERERLRSLRPRRGGGPREGAPEGERPARPARDGDR